MTIIEKDPDLYLNESIPCATGVSRGYREIIDFCVQNPDVYIDITSTGTFKHQSGDDYSIASQKGFILSAADFIRMLSDQFDAEAKNVAIRGDAKVSIVSGNGASIDADTVAIRGDAKVSIASDDGVSIDADTVVINGSTMTRINRPVLLLADGRTVGSDALGQIIGLSNWKGSTEALINDALSRLSGVESAAGGISEIQSSVDDVLSDISSLKLRIEALEAASGGDA